MIVSDVITLIRLAYLPWGTYGKLVLPDGREFYTVELPWNDNKGGESCIYEGTFFLGLRYSPVVKRTSGGLFDEGWEVQDVMGRSFIMLHPANWPSDLKGCIGVGESLSIFPDKSGKQMVGVTNSRNTFEVLMNYLDTRNSWVLNIIGHEMGYMDA